MAQGLAVPSLVAALNQGLQNLEFVTWCAALRDRRAVLNVASDNSIQPRRFLRGPDIRRRQDRSASAETTVSLQSSESGTYRTRADAVANARGLALALLLSSLVCATVCYAAVTVKNIPEAREQEPCKTFRTLAHGGTEEDALEVPTLPRPLPRRERFFLGWGPRVV